MAAATNFAVLGMGVTSAILATAACLLVVFAAVYMVRRRRRQSPRDGMEQLLPAGGAINAADAADLLEPQL